MMNINILIICILILIIYMSTIFIYQKNISKRYTQKDLELSLKKFELFNSLDPKKIKDEIDNLVNQYFTYYVLYHFEAHQKKYIKEDEINNGIRDITKNIVIEMSELYTYYFKLLYNINTEDQITAKVYELVTDTMIAYASEINKPKESEEARA